MRFAGSSRLASCTLGRARDDATHGGGGMPWVWSDDLAARLLEAGFVEPGKFSELLAQPVAFAVDDPEDLVRLGLDVFGLEVSEPMAS